jgi:hypothetical protein
MTTPTGPPARLLTRAARVRRQRIRTTVVASGVAFAVLLTMFTLRAATRPNVDVHLGSSTFRIGRAADMAKRIEADRYPLLFQDLRDKSIDLFVWHSGKNHLTGWRAVEAHAPGAPRSCQLKWDGSGYIDPCTRASFPATGDGLRRFQVNVVEGVLYVNFRASA